MAQVYVSIGSNIDREKNIRSAIMVLKDHFGELDLSSIYETAAVGFDGEAFYNLVAGFTTDDPIDVIASWLDEVENDHGRDRSGPSFGPRTLDIDLLVVGDQVAPEFRVPRDEIEKYAFVLGPLAEIAPHGRHPESGKCFADMWQGFDQASQPMKKINMTL